MKLVILAGGMGQRLSRRTNDLPKPMLEIADKPIIWHIMKYYSGFGIKDFVICLGYRGDIIRNFFINYRIQNSDITIDLKTETVRYHNFLDEKDWTVTLSDTGINALKGARLKKVEKYLEDDVNLLTYADGLGDIDINALVAHHKKMGKPVTITAVHPPEPFGCISVKDGIVTSFREKSTDSDRLINGGFMAFDKKLLEHLSEEDSCDLEQGLLEKLAMSGETASYIHNGNWICMDNEADLILLNRLYCEGKAFWKNW
jgi:glucose-1-phosphate cytidylyltransferase